MPTLKEARALFKAHAPTKYQGSRYTLLHTLIEATFRGSKNTDLDITSTVFTVKMDNIRKPLRVASRQIMRLIKTVKEVQVIERKDGKLTYRLNLKPLDDAEPIKTVQARQNKERTEAARLKKAAQRAADSERNRLTDTQQFFVDLVEGNRKRQEEFNKEATA
jgi:hypothetical protein